MLWFSLVKDDAPLEWRPLTSCASKVTSPEAIVSENGSSMKPPSCSRTPDRALLKSLPLFGLRPSVTVAENSSPRSGPNAEGTETTPRSV